ncbi:17825_t:CDS:2 [Funneliformis caledonium]|uniref:17825_t:CDS:1 n=1 Tax=Funneliformis caledonium TaxID=1117310 RepID=A0A9N8ZD43_9GLOM|nr:17825_t:CDS:2 [Funneliformis caledonium]
MGKERAVKKERHNPLHVQILEDKNPGRKNFKIKALKRNQEKDDEYVEPSLSRKILTIAREQQEELEEESNLDKSQINKEDQSQLFSSIIEDESEEDDHSDEEENFDYEELEIDENDQVILEKFLPNAPKERKTLADLIIEKIEARKFAKDDTTSASQSSAISPKVVEVYTKVGTLLSRYKSGKLPKAFKIIPSLSNWEDILYLTHPENWTPHATFQATRIFVSNLKANQTQRFFDLVLLEKVRDDIQENKKLNYHLYMALKKALYKPAAFFKGILFPLCESGTCTLKEAVIIGSVISKVSIPMLHSSAGLLRLAEMEYSGSNSLFIRILLDKKYALPYKVVDALVFHFMRFKNDERTMPVLWHQSFLVFAQRYKQDLTPEQKNALLDVLKVKSHNLITPEIRREIVNSVTRGEIMVDEMEIV